MEDWEDHEEGLPVPVDGRVGPGRHCHAQRGEKLRQVVRMAEAGEALGGTALGRCARCAKPGLSHEDRWHHGRQDHKVEGDWSGEEGGGDELLHLPGVPGGLLSPTRMASHRLDS